MAEKQNSGQKLDFFQRLGGSLLGAAAGIQNPAELSRQHQEAFQFREKNRMIQQQAAARAAQQEFENRISLQRVGALPPNSPIQTPSGDVFNAPGPRSTFDDIQQLMSLAGPSSGLPIGTTVSTQTPFGRMSIPLTTPESEIRAKETAKTNIKRETLASDLDQFFTIDDQIQRGEGFLGRLSAGGSSVIAGLNQSTPEGAAVATHDAMRKRLRVSLVRAAGDVGNLNIVEQKAAEQLIPTLFDAPKTAQLKRSLLQELSSAIDGKEKSKVKATIEKFMKSDAFKGQKDNNKLSTPSGVQFTFEEVK